MNKLSLYATTILCFTLFSCSLFSADKPIGLTYDEQVHNFGHVGIDFRLFHTYKYVNQTDKVVNITEIDVSCDCSEVNTPTRAINPGDTAYFNLIFSTKDYYGPTTKSFIVSTTDPTMPSMEFFYQSIVGQWYNGLKPQPLSIFFLPGKDQVKVLIANKFFDSIDLEKNEQYDKVFKVDIIEDSADKDDSLELIISPADNISKGTFNSVLTLTINTNSDKPTVISIPIKIVRY